MTNIWTRKQREGLYKVFLRRTASENWGWMNQRRVTNFRYYRAFRRKARLDPLMGCVMVPWQGMVLGIESDGHTHS
jgi:hypothetical protein